MTTAELIEKLQEFPPEAEVHLDADKYTLVVEGADLRANDESDDQYVLLWGM